MFPAERMALSRLFEDAEVTPPGKSQRSIRVHFTNENTPSSFGNVVVVNDNPTVDVLTTEIKGNSAPIVEESVIVISDESFKVSKIGVDEDGFTLLDLKRND